MIVPLFSARGLPRYHAGMLIMGLQPSMSRFWYANESAPLATATATATPASSAMERLSRRGMIKRVTPLSPAPAKGGSSSWPPTPISVLAAAASTTTGLPVSAALGAMASQTHERDANAGVCIIELEAGADDAQLRDEMAEDPDVTFVARVPVRYVAVKRPRRSRKAALAAAGVPPAGDMWNLNRIGWGAARQLVGFKDADAIKVAVLDTGIDIDHPDLAGRIAAYTHSFDGRYRSVRPGGYRRTRHACRWNDLRQLRQ